MQNFNIFSKLLIITTVLFDQAEREEKGEMFQKWKTYCNLKGKLSIDFHMQCVIMTFLVITNDVLKTYQI